MDVKDKLTQLKDQVSGSDTWTYARYIVILVVIGACCWALLRNVYDNRRATDELREQLSTAREQLDRTSESLRSIQNGLNDSQRTVDDLEKSNSAAQATVDRLADINQSVTESVDRASKANSDCSELVADSQRRVGQSKSILEEVRKTGKPDANSN